MDAFPDELLLEVLGCIDDGLTLLDVVPLVCKRWHRLSTDPGAWNSVSVSIVGCRFDEGYAWDHDNHEEILNAARVLIHAPALRRVSFDWSLVYTGPFSCSYDRKTMTSALGRCAAKVREIAFPQPDAWTDDVGNICCLSDALPEELFAGFLSKNSGCVRSLKMRAGTQLMHALAQCESLQELDVMLLDRRRCTYRGELRGRQLPKLKRLTFATWSEVDNCRAFLRDLVGCVARSVLHIRCYSFCESSEDVLADLSLCVELQSLTCGVESVALARTLPRLRSLRLVIQSMDDDYQRHQEALSAAERALRGCGQLEDLRDLRLIVGYTFAKWGAEHSQALSTLLTTLATKATNVKHFSSSDMLDPLVSPETLLAFIKSLPRLESVDIDSFNEFNILSALAEIEGLKRVSGSVVYCIDNADAWHAALEQFKCQRPDVDCRLADPVRFDDSH